MFDDEIKRKQEQEDTPQPQRTSEQLANNRKKYEQVKFRPQVLPEIHPAPPPVIIQEQTIKQINQSNPTTQKQNQQQTEILSNSNNSKKNFSRNPKTRFTN